MIGDYHMASISNDRPHFSYTSYAADGQVYGYAEFVCDEVNDIAFLPVCETEIAIGSKCNCIENGKTYILNNAREWVEDISQNGSDGDAKDNVFNINFSGMTSDGNATCDKTWDEVFAAYKAGKTLTSFYHAGAAVIYCLNGSFEFSQDEFVLYSGITILRANEGLQLLRCGINRNGVVINIFN